MGRGVVRLARCIYSDIHGKRVKVQRGDAIEDRRFPPQTSLETLIKVRNDIEDRFAVGMPSTVRQGTLAADVAACLATMASRPARRDAATMLGYWLHATTTAHGTEMTFGDLPRADITPMMVRTQLAKFTLMTHPAGGRRFSPATVKELRRLLGWVWTTIDGADARNPVRAVKGPRVRYDDPRGIDYAIIERIFAAMPDRGRPQDGPAGGRRGKTARPTTGLTKIRLRVMAYTGMHQIELARLTPRDIDIKGRRVWIHARIKGAGAEGGWHALLDQAVEALRDFVAAKAWGRFSTRSMSTSWNGAIIRARAAWEADPAHRGEPWPVHADARPYDLRHSMGTAIYLETGDIRAAQAILRHRQGSTTDRYTRAGVPRRVGAAIAALNATFSGLPRTTPTEHPESDAECTPMQLSPQGGGVAAGRGRKARGPKTA